MHLSFTELKHFIWGRGCQSFLGFFVFAYIGNFLGKGYLYLMFPNNFIWTRKIVKEMCTGNSQCTIWTSFLTPPLLTRSVNDWHWRAGTYVYHKCIPRIYIICQHTDTKLLTNNRFIGDQIKKHIYSLETYTCMYVLYSSWQQLTSKT